MIDILGKRYWFFALSLLIILPGMILWAMNGLPLAIDFTGGSILEISFDSGKAPVNTEVIQAVPGSRASRMSRSNRQVKRMF